MKQIELTKGLKAIVDDEDYEKLSQYRWNANWTGTVHYAHRLNGKEHVYMHRMIMSPLPGYEIDHINKNTLDNRKSNLRIVHKSYQRANSKKRKDSRSKYKGVKLRGKHISARIRVNGKERHLGMFKTQEEAALAYNQAALKYFGDYAQLNEVA
jgi:hypothetical protein